MHEALIHSCEWRTIHSSTCTMQGLRMLCSLAFGCSAGVLVYAELFLGANDTQQTSALVVRLGVGKILCSFVLRFTHSENIHLCSIAQNLESSLAQNRCSRHNSWNADASTMARYTEYLSEITSDYFFLSPESAWFQTRYQQSLITTINCTYTFTYVIVLWHIRTSVRELGMERKV